MYYFSNELIVNYTLNNFGSGATLCRYRI